MIFGGSVAVGHKVAQGGVTIVTDGAGLQARDNATNEPIAAHQSFWFAWSQFHPDTLVWER